MNALVTRKNECPASRSIRFPLWASASETRGQLSANRYEYLKGVNRQEVVTSKPPELRPANLQLTWRAVASSLLISTCRTPYSVRFRTKMQTAGLSSWKEMGLLFFRVRSSGRKNMDKPAIHTLALAREALFTLCVEIQRTGGSPADAIRLSEAMARVRSAERRLKKERVRADIAIPDDEHTRF